MKTKKCVKCEKDVDIDFFFNNKRSKDGLHSWCKLCSKEYNTTYRKERLDIYKEHARNHRKRNKNYLKENREYKKEYSQTFNGTITRLLSAAKSRAKRKNIEFDLTTEWVISHLTKMKCEASGVTLTLIIDENAMHTAFRPSIDRIDNNLGYIIDNCQIVCVMYNKMKSDYNEHEINVFLKAIMENFGNEFNLRNVLRESKTQS